MVDLEWKSCNFTGSGIYIFKEKLKYVKNCIKVWKAQHWEVDEKEVIEAKTEMLHQENTAENKLLSETEVFQLKDARVKYLQAEKDLFLCHKQKWAVEEDKNSRFFHGMIKGRLKRNSIKGIMYNGTWVEDPGRIKQVFFDLFTNQYQESNMVRPSFRSTQFKQLANSQSLTLQAPFSEEEIKGAIWNCADDKAHGPDGFTFAFLKAHWDTIKNDIICYVKDFEIFGRLVKGGNSTFLTLIPKGDDPLSPADYRPISLVGCQYKSIAKILAEKLKLVLPDLISENQSAFVAGRQILEGVLMANEVVSQAKSCSNKLMLLKIDLAKAYDCVN